MMPPHQLHGGSLYGAGSSSHPAGPSGTQAPALNNNKNNNNNNNNETCRKYRTNLISPYELPPSSSGSSSRSSSPSSSPAGARRSDDGSRKIRKPLPPPPLGHPVPCDVLLRHLLLEIRRCYNQQGPIAASAPLQYHHVAKPIPRQWLVVTHTPSSHHPRPIFRLPLPNAGFHIMLCLQKTNQHAVLSPSDRALWEEELLLLACLGVHGGLRLLPSGRFAARFVRVRNLQPGNTMVTERQEAADFTYWRRGEIEERIAWDTAHAHDEDKRVKEQREKRQRVEREFPLLSELTQEERQEIWERPPAVAAGDNDDDDDVDWTWWQ